MGSTPTGRSLVMVGGWWLAVGNRMKARSQPTDYSRPTANHQPPTTNNQQPTAKRGTVRQRQSGQAQTLEAVGSTPTCATGSVTPSDARWSAEPPVKRPPFAGNVGSIPTRGTAIVDCRLVIFDWNDGAASALPVFQSSITNLQSKIRNGPFV